MFSPPATLSSSQASVGPDLEICRRPGSWQTGGNQAMCIPLCFIRLIPCSHSISQSPSEKEAPSWNQCVPSLGVIFLLPCSLFLPQPPCRGNSESTDSPWERSVWWDGGTKSRLGQTGPASFCLCICSSGHQKLFKNKTERSSRGTGQPPSPLLPDLSRLPQARWLCQHLPGSPDEESGQSNCVLRSSQAAFCLLNYSNNNLGGDKAWQWEHRLCAFLLT